MKRNGFTLLELMIIIAIIGILVATVLPMFQGRDDEKAIAPTVNVSPITGSKCASGAKVDVHADGSLTLSLVNGIPVTCTE